MSRRLLYACLALSALTSNAAADVVMMPDTACLAGSRPVLAHHGPVCEVAACSSDTDCEQARRRFPGMDVGVCQQRRLCVRDIAYSGPSGGYGPANVTHTVVVGACEGSLCREDRAPWETAGGYGDASAWRLIGEKRCEQQRVCAPSASAPESEPEDESEPESEPAPEPESETSRTEPEASEPQTEQNESGCSASAGEGFGFVAFALVLLTLRRNRV